MQYVSIPGTDGRYFACDDGCIYSMRTNEYGKEHLVKLTNDISNGYARVKIYGKHWQVHTLIALCFLPSTFPGLDIVGHKDGNKTNNLPENLYWTNRSFLSSKRV